jgi:tetrahydromethanopterin S-methyltransferase subunit F
MLSLLGLFVIVSAEFLFSYSAVGGNTNWSIFYFASSYLGFAMVGLDILFKENSKSVRYTGLTFGIFFVLLVLIELSFINMPFEEYIVSVNNNKIRVIACGLVIPILIFITLKAWEGRRSKK